MSDENKHLDPSASSSDAGSSLPPPPPPASAYSASAAAEGFDAATVEAGKTFAILGYALSFVGLPFFLVPVITRDNAYSLYHAKQSMMIWLAGIIVSVVSVILTVICIGPIVGLVGALGLLVLNILGLLQSVNGEAKPLPLVGKYAVEWFKGLTLVPKP